MESDLKRELHLFNERYKVLYDKAQSIGAKYRVSEEQKRMRESLDKSHSIRRKALDNEYAMQKDIDQARTAKELKAKLYPEEVERQREAETDALFARLEEKQENSVEAEQKKDQEEEDIFERIQRKQQERKGMEW